MYTLLHKLGSKAFLARESPALLVSWIIAELFYKFGSFTLETGAFTNNLVSNRSYFR